MLKLVSNKKIISSLLACSVLFGSNLSAAPADCGTKTFNIKVQDSVSKLDILNQLSDICNFTVVTKDDLAKMKLNEKQQGINIKNLAVDDIFNLLLKENGLDYNFDGNILRVSGYVVQTYKLDYINSIREASALLEASVETASDSGSSSDSGSGSSSSAGANSVKSSEKFDFWNDIGKEIKNILVSVDQSTPVIDPIVNQNTGMITVRGTKEQVDKISEYIDTMKNRLKKQAIIDVSIIEVQFDKSNNRGIDWSRFDLTFNTKFNVGGDNANAGDNADANNTQQDIFNGFSNVFISNGTSGKNFRANMGINLDGILNFLDTNGKTRVVANPKIIAMNNQPAIISVGKTVNYILKDTTNNDGGGSSEGTENKSLFIGILLNILPEISDDNKIMLRINPALSDFLYKDDDKKQQNARDVAPDTQQKKLSTVVRVHDGQTIILGGLIDTQNIKNKTEVPVLSKIPILGYLFKYEADSVVNREIVFVITPKIVELGDYEHKQSLRDLGYSDMVFGLKDDNDKNYGFVTIKKLHELKTKKETLDDMGYDE